uniref:Uncharacterized protein n=1 Tax=Panagrolaimus davidi TaxID=227884 RepID=A0A914QQR7_9BILA
MDDLMDLINMIKARMIKQQTDFQEMLQQTPPPWSNIQKIDFEVMLESLTELKTRWDGEMEHIKARIDRLPNQDQNKEDLKQQIRVLKNDEDNEEMLQRLKNQTSKLQKLLLLDNSLDSSVLGTPAPSIAGSSEDEEEPYMIPTNVSSLIPKFDGEYTKWNSFWELFDLYVHRRKYPDVSKLATLRSLLQGRALGKIESFTTCSANYPNVVKTLKDRFGNEQFVIRELETKLDSYPQAQPNAASIARTVTAVTNLCQQLKNLGFDTNNTSMKNTVVKKMPVKQQIELQKLLFKEPTTSIDTVLEKMTEMEVESELVASILQSSSSSATPSKKQNVDSPNGSWKRENGPSMAHQKRFPCSFCDGDHRSFNCQTYATAEQRIQQLQKKKKCIKPTLYFLMQKW